MTQQPAADAPPVVNHPCDACGQLDDHPTIHVWGPWRKDERTYIQDPSFHFDCLPEQFESMLGDDVSGPQHRNTRQAIKAARAGKHGSELREHIKELAEQHDDNAVEPADHPVVPGMAVAPQSNVEA